MSFRRVAVLAAALTALLSQAQCTSVADRSMVVGVHHQNGDYSFTSGDLLNEGADQVLALGCRSIGVYMGPEYADYYPGIGEDAGSLAGLARTEAFSRFFSKPFSVYSITCYAFAGGLDRKWRGGIEEYDAEREYEEVRGLAELLLRRYRGSGKTFILKNWEGDWQLLGGYDGTVEPAEGSIRAMVSWLRARVRGVEDARASVAAEGVHVYSAVEFNFVLKAAYGGNGKTMLTHVVPYVPADLYSYSAWDCLEQPEDILPMLRLIKRYAPDSENFGARNVMIGEFGFPGGDSDKVNRIRRSLDIFRRWGVPYCFYWQIYGNECDGERFYPSGSGARRSLRCRDFGLVDQMGRRTPAWNYFQKHIFGNTTD